MRTSVGRGQRVGERPVLGARAASALELLVGFVILGLVAALTIPQFSRASEETREQALRRTLASLRTAIDMYYADYAAYPASACADGSDAGTSGAFVQQLTRRAGGKVYLRDGLPDSPVRKQVGGGVEIIRGTALPSHLAESQADWIYNCDTGYIVANSDTIGVDGIRFDRY